MTVDDASNTGFPVDQRGWSVYVHFPFCRHRCAYCDFATVAAEVIPRQQYTRNVLRELQLRCSDAAAAPISTVYFGGGTPSLWGAQHIAQVLQWLDDWGGLTDGAEITLEANPGATDAAQMDELCAAGVNRLSIGVQAVDDGRLQALDRVHDAGGALATLGHMRELLQRGRLVSASADLMLGGPHQGLGELRADVEKVLQFRMPHLSVYALTVEDGTPLAAQVDRGLRAPPDEELQADMLAALPGWLADAGLAQYEVSNFAAPGHESRHNTAYWKGHRYLAVGVGAHGFIPSARGVGRRYGNHRDLRAWTADIATGRHPEAFGEQIDAAMHADERLLTGLRLRAGVDVGPWRAWAPDGWVDALLRAADELSRRGDPVAVDGERVRVLPKAWPVLNDWVLRLSEAAASFV